MLIISIADPMPVIHPFNKLNAFVMPFAEKRHTATSHNKSETKEMVPSSTNHHSPPFQFQSSGFSNGEKKVEANGEDLAGFILARPVELQSQSNALLIPEDEQADSLTSSSWILPKPAVKRQRMVSHAKICLAMKSRYLVPLGRNVHNISPTFNPFEETTENKGQEHRSPLTSSDLFLPRLEL